MKDHPNSQDADTFIQRQRELRATTRITSESENSELLRVRHTILLSITLKDNMARGKAIDECHDGKYLIAQYLLGIDLSYLAIVEGLYPQAANLQKQQIETLCRLEELRTGRAKDGKNPNVRQKRLPGMNCLYGNLNKAAHPSRTDVIRSLSHHESESGRGPTHDPQYNREICNTLLGNHCVLLLYLWRDMADLFKADFGIQNSQDEERALEVSIEFLRQAGFISIVDTTSE